MSVLRQIDDRLAALESRLADRPEIAGEVRAIRRLLTAGDGAWIGTVEAQRLLGVKSINTVKAWARLGVLRSRREPNGRIKVSLEDVLARRSINADLEGDGDNRELSPEEHRILGSPLSPEERENLEAGMRRLGVAPLPEG